ncbi:MAG: hypothetical protein HFH37_12690 [Lachnospiraceae bacterium]|nr:hypothetical protein [Lachnospiraceae bacterium]
MLRKNAVRILTGIFAVGMCLMNVNVANAASVSWDLHAQPGNYVTSNVKGIVNNGNGYIARCNNVSGTAPSKITNIKEYTNSSCTSIVTLNKTVQFTSTGSIEFKHNSMPSVDRVYMKATLSYSNGKTANMSGTIQTK